MSKGIWHRILSIEVIKLKMFHNLNRLCNFRWLPQLRIFKFCKFLIFIRGSFVYFRIQVKRHLKKKKIVHKYLFSSAQGSYTACGTLRARCQITIIDAALKYTFLEFASNQLFSDIQFVRTLMKIRVVIKQGTGPWERG